MENNIGSYHIERVVNGNLKIHYRRSRKDLYYIIVYLLLSVPILFVSLKIISFLVSEKTNFKVIFFYCFSGILLLIGLYFLSISVETFSKATKNVFFIDIANRQLLIKRNVFKTLQFNFNEIKQFQIGAKDITVNYYNKGRTYKKQLYLIHMHIELRNGKTVKVHQFEGPELMISYFEKKKNKSLKEVSKQITEIISKECGKEFYWKGTQKE